MNTLWREHLIDLLAMNFEAGSVVIVSPDGEALTVARVGLSANGRVVAIQLADAVTEVTARQSIPVGGVIPINRQRERGGPWAETNRQIRGNGSRY